MHLSAVGLGKLKCLQGGTVPGGFILKVTETNEVPPGNSTSPVPQPPSPRPLPESSRMSPEWEGSDQGAVPGAEPAD